MPNQVKHVHVPSIFARPMPTMFCILTTPQLHLKCSRCPLAHANTSPLNTSLYSISHWTLHRPFVSFENGARKWTCIHVQVLQKMSAPPWLSVTKHCRKPATESPTKSQSKLLPFHTLLHLPFCLLESNVLCTAFHFIFLTCVSAVPSPLPMPSERQEPSLCCPCITSWLLSSLAFVRFPNYRGKSTYLSNPAALLRPTRGDPQTSQPPFPSRQAFLTNHHTSTIPISLKAEPNTSRAWTGQRNASLLSCSPRSKTEPRNSLKAISISDSSASFHLRGGPPFRAGELCRRTGAQCMSSCPLTRPRQC